MQTTEQRNATGALAQHGFVGLLLQMWTKRRPAKCRRERRMQLIETLSLGGKRQVQLVRCGGEQFLLGGSLDSVETIVKVSCGIDQNRESLGGAIE